MNIKRYSTAELDKFDRKGYEYVPCTDEEQSVSLKNKLKNEGRCAQAGYIVRSDHNINFFVLTKEASKNRGRPRKVV